ncbi:MAG TPA: NAD-dependent epimerase/dehydratase family protein [Gaiellaceae bacterium]|nr:NAD-dependent epimerase/dehydratase family protein [Gaiellaceae bacterium]
MRAIVTGGAGFIGSHVVDALLARGDEVHVLDDLSKGTRDNVTAGAELHVADIREPEAVFDTVRPEAVFHFAAQADVRFSVQSPAVDAEMNIFGTLQVLEAARRYDAQVVLASTGGAIYGECDGRPATESTPRQPLSPYGTSKLAAEEYLATYNRLYDAGHVSLRLSNVYGPRQAVHGEAGVVAIFTGLLRDGGTPQIFGDGTQTRDYVYVRDVARATLAALGRGGVFNIGTGLETSVLELYEALARASGVARLAEHVPARLGELQRSVLDVSLAARELDWTPEVTLEDGLARTWEWATA